MSDKTRRCFALSLNVLEAILFCENDIPRNELSSDCVWDEYSSLSDSVTLDNSDTDTGRSGRTKSAGS